YYLYTIAAAMSIALKETPGRAPLNSGLGARAATAPCASAAGAAAHPAAARQTARTAGWAAAVKRPAAKTREQVLSSHRARVEQFVVRNALPVNSYTPCCAPPLALRYNKAMSKSESRILSVTRLGAKGQITIPAEYRRTHSLQGDAAVVLVQV